METPLLEVRNLTTVFDTSGGTITAVNNVSFSLNKGQTVCLVGESGCGKSVTSLSIMRLIADPPGKISNGEVLFNGQDLLSMPESAMQKIRGNDISMIFQEPMTSLNPVFTIGDQIGEVLKLHMGMNSVQARERTIELLRQVGIPAPERRINEHPHQLSGGMRQRVMIAMALACNPKLLIADEPTTALDVTIQGQILELLNNLTTSTGASVLLITHDLGVVAETAEHVVIMYAGRVVEDAPVKDIFASPLHPYTQGLMRSVPPHPALFRNTSEKLRRSDPEQISHDKPTNLPQRDTCTAVCKERWEERCEERCDETLPPSGLVSGSMRSNSKPTDDKHFDSKRPDNKHLGKKHFGNRHSGSMSIDSHATAIARKGELQTIRGSVPSLLHLPAGCTFHDRCEHAFDRCKKEEPPLIARQQDTVSRNVRCWLYI